jgi:hypothetical protein
VQDRGLKKHTESLIEEARQLLDAAGLLPPGALRNEALKKARQAEVAAHSEDGIDSPSLQPPKNGPPISQFASRCSQANRAQSLLQRMQAQRQVPNSGDFE